MRRAATRLAAAVLLAALLPVPAAAVEIGEDDFRISPEPPPSAFPPAAFRATTPAAAYNPIDDEYLVVWSGASGQVRQVGEDVREVEIMGQRVSASGARLGGAFRISAVGPAGNLSYEGREPHVAHNPNSNEYLVVWEAKLGSIDEEIFAQRLSADGTPVGEDDFQVSDMAIDAESPRVVHNTSGNEYLVVWQGSYADKDHKDIFGQRLTEAGAAIGVDDFNITQTYVDPEWPSGAFGPRILHNPMADEFLLAFHRLKITDPDDPTIGPLSSYRWTHAQRLNGSGQPLGLDVPVIENRRSPFPAVAHNTDRDEYLVLGFDTANELVAQRLSRVVGLVGPSVRISQLEGTPVKAEAAYNPGSSEYLVAWWHRFPEDGSEIFGQRLSTDLDELGAPDFPISQMGPPDDMALSGGNPGLAHRQGTNQFLVVWNGQKVLNNHAVWGQLLEEPLVAPTVGLVDVSQGRWYLRNSAGQVTPFFYGNPVDLPIAGDWDGDGVATPGLYRQSDGFFYARDSNTQGPADNSCFAGDPADIPLSGDWDGDGDDNLGIYRPSQQRFYLFTKTCTGSPMGAAQIAFTFGNPGDQPTAGDWDGDGVDEVGLYRESSGFFYWRETLNTGIADGQIFFGDPGDRFVSGDWGIVDGVDTPAVFRPRDLTFYFRHRLTQGNADSQFRFTPAQPNWLPVAGNFGLG